MDSKNCVTCGAVFVRTPGYQATAWKKKKYCSLRCSKLLSLKDRIDRHSRVDSTGCWLWTGAVDKDGYGRIDIGRTTKRAHRVSYETHVGVIPDHICVCHKCDVPTCVNPKHLFLGTTQANTADMDAKGRRVTARGERSGTSKLTDAEVIRLRAMDFSKWGSLSAEAKRLGLDKKTVWHAVRGSTWKHLPAGKRYRMQEQASLDANNGGSP